MRRREGIVRFFQSRLANTLSSFTLPSFEELPLAGLRDEAGGKRSKRAATLLNEFSTARRVVVSHCPCTQLRSTLDFARLRPLLGNVSRAIPSKEPEEKYFLQFVVVRVLVCRVAL